MIHRGDDNCRLNVFSNPMPTLQAPRMPLTEVFSSSRDGKFAATAETCFSRGDELKEVTAAGSGSVRFPASSPPPRLQCGATPATRAQMFSLMIRRTPTAMTATARTAARPRPVPSPMRQRWPSPPQPPPTPLLQSPAAAASAAPSTSLAAASTARPRRPAIARPLPETLPLLAASSGDGHTSAPTIAGARSALAAPTRRPQAQPARSHSPRSAPRSRRR